jgi:hypothetical protein
MQRHKYGELRIECTDNLEIGNDAGYQELKSMVRSGVLYQCIELEALPRGTYCIRIKRTKKLIAQLGWEQELDLSELAYRSVITEASSVKHRYDDKLGYRQRAYLRFKLLNVRLKGIMRKAGREVVAVVRELAVNSRD